MNAAFIFLPPNETTALPYCFAHMTKVCKFAGQSSPGTKRKYPLRPFPFSEFLFLTGEILAFGLTVERVRTSLSCRSNKGLEIVNST